MSNEKFMPPYTTNKSLSPKLVWYNSRIKLKFKGSCLKQDKASFTPKNVVSLFIVYELDNTWPRDLNTDFTLKNCLFGSLKLTKNADSDKYSYSGYGIGFDSCSYFSLSDNTTERNVVIFEADMNSSVHTDNKGKDILILDEGPTQGLDDTTLTAEVKYSINFTQSNRKFCLSLHYNGSNSFLFVNGTKIHEFKAKDFEIKTYPLCLGNISVDFSANNMIKAGFDGPVYDFSVDYNFIDTSNIINIHKYLMKKYEIK